MFSNAGGAAMLRAIALTGVLALSACAQMSPSPTTSAPSRDDVVNVTGHDGFKFGDSRAELAPLINQDLQGCHSQLAGRPEGSLVFDQDERLVLFWFDAPLHTPDGINTGDPLAELSAAYPQAIALSAPAESHRFDGLLVRQGDYGYLFLHDGKSVRKAIAGYVDYLERLFDSGFGVC
ncbi:hypothetical protein Rhe02_70990 [Rhizocola hellebori]|uniref:Uncharacterized protein n=1 Tax=Rhizocola hellebori TaxID=1392758 RepID=A0A8J3QFF6_9ACTN|nr:hypothetical protein [Rhizocola hellebori]GIH09032.1 hypothetical protein Rhe02_70990 [Rhizocola hellebori]